jgi:hypothetical protein
VGAPIAVQEGSRFVTISRTQKVKFYLVVYNCVFSEFNHLRYRLLGLYDNGQLSRQSNKSDNATVSDPHMGFFGCGYAIQVTGWQLIMVVGSRGEVTANNKN